MPSQSTSLDDSLTQHWMPAFLLSLRKDGNISTACEKAGINRQTAYNYRRDEDAFKQRWEVALLDAVDMLRKEAWRRATKRTDPSDKLLMFLLEAHDPKRYRRNSDVNVGPTYNFVFGDQKYVVRSTEELEALPTEVLERIKSGDYTIEDVDYKILGDGNADG